MNVYVYEVLVEAEDEETAKADLEQTLNGRVFQVIDGKMPTFRTRLERNKLVHVFKNCVLSAHLGLP